MAAAGRLPESMRHAEQRLGELASLSPNWDSYDGDPPSALAIAATYDLLQQVAERFADVGPARLQPFAMAATPDGGVHVEWREPAREVAVDIGPTGSYGYLLLCGQGSERRYTEADDVPLATILELAEQTLRPARGG